MKIKTTGMLALFASCVFVGSAFAQDLGPQVKKLADGVYVHTGKGFESNSGIILTQDGVVVIDTGQNPIESRDVMATVKKLTSMPVPLEPSISRTAFPSPHGYIPIRRLREPWSPEWLMTPKAEATASI